MKVESIAECSPLSILQCFLPALSNNRSWKPIFVFFLSGRLRQVLLYILNSYWSTKTYVVGTQKKRLDGSFEHPKHTIRLMDKKTNTILH